MSLHLGRPAHHGYQRLGEGTVDIEVVGAGDKLAVVLLELFEQLEGIADAAAREAVEPEHVEASDETLTNLGADSVQHRAREVRCAGFLFPQRNDVPPCGRHFFDAVPLEIEGLVFTADSDVGECLHRRDVSRRR